MQTQPYRYRQLFKALHSMAGLLTIIALCTTHSAWSQQPHISTALIQYHAVNTPSQVMSGTAKLVQPYDPTSKLRLAINITPPKMAEEEELLKDLQDRKSPNFHKWLTPEQVIARFSPEPQDEQAVVDWLTSQGLTITARYPNRLMVDAEGTVDQIQKAFNVKINRYEVNGEVEFSNDRDPVIPANLADTIQYIEGLNSILRMRPANSSMKGMRGPDYSPGPVRQEGGSGGRDADQAAVQALKSSESRAQVGSQVTNGFYDPSDIWGSNMYDYDALMAQGHCCNPFHTSGYGGGSPIQTSIGLATDGAFLNSDMYGFVAQYPYLASHWFIHWVDGTPSCCDDETTLDTEWSTATSNSRGSEFDTSSIHVYETAEGFGTFGDIYQQMLTDNLVNVVNISYGLNEDYLNGLGLVSAWHGKFNSMLLQGWTIMAASGDNGAAAGCGDAIAVLYPESDPDVVSVGGTQLALNSDGTFNSEVTWTGDNYSGACSSNHGGTGGGCSNLFSAPGYQSSPACGSGSRSVPDIALNASSHSAQNYYFEGSLQGVAGTSIASPMMSGFVAQANAYLVSIGLGGTPLGELDYDLYYFGNNPSYAPHYPYYDVTLGCNSNDITNLYGLGSYCAHPGYDVTTGWGSFNALQLSWAINAYWLGAFETPTITFSGPFTGANGSDHWYNTDQTVSWTIKSNAESGLTPTGVAGYSATWDNYFSDPFTEATPGSGNSFYSGPEYPNATSGSLDLAAAGQGCHFATVDAWDNAGYTPGEEFYYFVCYDTVPPVSTATLSGTLHGSVYDTDVKVTITSTDASSGVAHTYYNDGSGYVVYSGPLTFAGLGTHTVLYYSTDVAGNSSAVKSVSFTISSLTTTTLTSSLNPSIYGESVTFTAKVVASLSGTPAGSVQFLKSGVVVATETLASGKATYTTSALDATTHPMTAVYVGNIDDITSTSSAVNEVVDKANTTASVIASVNPSMYNQPVTFTATITPAHGGTPTGTVTFEKFGVSLGTVTLSGGKAVFTTSALLVATHTITAVYAGDSDFIGSTSPGISEVTKAASTTTALTLSPNPSSYGKAITLTATVAGSFGGAISGTVTFYHATTVLGTGTLSGNVAKLTVSNLSVGTSHLSATYGGSTNYLISTSSIVAQVVDKASTTTTLTSSENPSTSGTSVTFTATVKAGTGPTPTGSVTFKDGSTTLGSGTLNSSGVATFSTSSLAVGSHSIVASHGGNTNDGTSFSATLTQKVN
jgi:subtilase family serine protease